MGISIHWGVGVKWVYFLRHYSIESIGRGEGVSRKGKRAFGSFGILQIFLTRQCASVAININWDQPTADKENAVQTLMIRDSPPTWPTPPLLLASCGANHSWGRNNNYQMGLDTHHHHHHHEAQYMLLVANAGMGFLMFCWWCWGYYLYEQNNLMDILHYGVREKQQYS